jgi:hypothetical protein
MIIFNDKNYCIKKSNRGYVVINLNGDYKNHSHFNKLGAVKKCIHLTKNRIVPKSLYMMLACMRLSTDELYIRKIEKLKTVKENKKKSRYTNKKISIV